ncbi:MAG: SurA N-terminal domain-containing protein [Deltaproteobacteria bacterium]|nr:MAG: SurA N-terminal domain-containing protein [Deltaproteobacteria bacterium]
MFITMLRRHTKGIIIKVMVGLIATVFIFWGIYSIREKPGTKIAYVNGDLITGQEYDAVYRDMLDALQRQYRQYWNDNLIRVFRLRQRALDSLIDKRLISQEAERLGLRITDDEVADAIRTDPAFQVNGGFDEGRYRSLLRYNRMEPADFESRIRSELLGQKIHRLIRSFFPLTDMEIRHFYTYQKEKINISFVSFNPKDFREKVEVKQDEKEDYFKENKEKYKAPERIKIAYLTLDPSDFVDKVTITEREVSDYYELNQEKFKDPKKIKARHILLKLSPDASESEEATAKEKALDILKKARDGEDFSELARKYSQDPTASKGGDLGYFTSGKMAKPFEDLAFSLKSGELGGPVKTRFGWHIIKVDDVKDAVVKTLPEVRDQIVATLEKDIRTDIAHERSLTLMDQMPYDIDLATYAAQHGLTVTESGYFSKKGSIPGLGGDERLKKSIYALKKGDVSEVIEHRGKFYIIQVVDSKDSYIPKPTEVSDQLDKDFRDHLSLVAAKEEAEGYLEELKGGADWSELAKAKGLKEDETGFFARGANIPKIGYSPSLHEAAFSLSSENRYPDQVFEVKKKAYIIRWLEREDINTEDFDKEKSPFKHSLLLAKGRRTSNAWLQSLKEKAEIKIVTPLE